MARGPRSGARAVLVAIVGASLAAGCVTSRPATPDPATLAPPASGAATAPPSAAPPNDELLAEIRSTVEALRGLHAVRDVPVTILDAAAARDYAARRVAAEHEAREDEVIPLRLLGFHEPGASWAASEVEVLAGVPGWYDPDEERIYVVDDGGPLDVMAQVTFGHEHLHALQDQHFPGAFPEDPRETDPITALAALAEGDAAELQAQLEDEWLTDDQRAELWRQTHAPLPAGDGPAIPAWVGELTWWAHVNGPAFVGGRRAGGGWAAVDAVWADPPVSTEQILHPDRYLAREPPLDVALPADLPILLGPDWSVTEANTLGEAFLELWLRTVGGEDGAATRRATTGWGGDATAIAQGPAGAEAIVIDSAWDRELDATEFAAAAGPAVAAIRADGRAAMVVRPGASRVVVVAADREATLERLAAALALAP